MKFTIFAIVLAANSAPPLLSAFYPRACARVLDCGRKWQDGGEILGGHKSCGGLAAGILAGGTVGFLMGVSLPAALAIGGLSMFGDLFTSFLKRRMGFQDGHPIYLFDQVFEGGFPLLWCKWVYSLSWSDFMAMLLLFCGIGILGSRLSHKLTTSAKPQLRMVRSPNRFREWRACHTALSPFARLLNFENVVYYRWFMRGLFKMARLYERGARNALDVRLKEFRLAYPELPAAFDPYRILFISDLHIDGLPGLCQSLIEQVKDLEVGLCLLGGDYRMEMYGNFSAANRKLGRLMPHIHARDGIFGILGNHDCLEIAPALEDCGICMLINESITIQKNGSEIAVVGVDDPHYYKCHDLAKAFSEVAPGTFALLLAHSPEVLKEASNFKIDLCLCGHTHAGQIRLPLIGPLFTHCKMPRRYTSGFWQYNDIKGFTSAGAGSSGIPVRFNCPPEIVLLTLTRG